MIFFSERQNHVMVFFIPSERWRGARLPSDFPLRRARCACSARLLLRLGRHRAEEGFSLERLRQIIRAATAPGRGHDGPDHKRMQIGRLTPALRLAADGVAQGDAKSITSMLKSIGRLDRYSDPHLVPATPSANRPGVSRLPLAS